MGPSKKITCYLGATIVGDEASRRVQHYSDLARSRVGLDAVIHQDIHITILPQFELTFEDATHFNLACGCSSLIPNHPLVSTLLIMKSLALLSWKEKHILHFPVTIPSQNNSAWTGKFITHKMRNVDRFSAYVSALRRKVASYGSFSWKEEVPANFFPHITLLTFESSSRVNSVSGIMRGSGNEVPLSFNVGYPTIYANDGTGGWYPLSHYPNFVDE